MLQQLFEALDRDGDGTIVRPSPPSCKLASSLLFGGGTVIYIFYMQNVQFLSVFLAESQRLSRVLRSWRKEVCVREREIGAACHAPFSLV